MGGSLGGWLPDYPSWWNGAPRASEYLELLKVVGGRVKQADPSAEVVLGSLTNSGASVDGGYLEQLYALGATEHFDTLAINAYGYDVAATMGYVRKARSVTQRWGDGAVPMRVTEYGWSTCCAATMSGKQTPLTVATDDCQAALLYASTKALRAFHQSLNIKSIIQFQWHDAPQDPANMSTSWPLYAGLTVGTTTKTGSVIRSRHLVPSPMLLPVSPSPRSTR